MRYNAVGLHAPLGFGSLARRGQALLAQCQLAEEERAQQNQTLDILAERAEHSLDPEQQEQNPQAMDALRQMQVEES